VGAALKKFAEEFEIVTCGVDAITGTELPQVTHKAAVDWGLNIEPKFSVNIKDVPGSIHFEDIVLVSDKYMKNSTYLKAANPKNVFVFADFALDFSQIPRDPVGMNLVEFKREIAKAIFCASRIMRSLCPSGNTGLEIEIRSISSDDQKAFHSVINYCETNAFNILLANFEIPLGLTSSSSQSRFEFLDFEDHGSFVSNDEGLDQNSEISIFSAKYEMTFRNEDFFSPDFRSSALKLASKRQLVIIFDFNALSPRVAAIQLLRASQLRDFPYLHLASVGSELEISSYEV
jgi:hypothetical protein